MPRLLTIPILFLIFISCSSDTVKKRDIIEDEKFRNLLIDFHKAEGVITIAKLNKKKKKSDTISPYNHILKKHNISRIEFENTIKYYSNHTEEYIPFYDSINNYFLEQKKEGEKSIEEDKKRVKEDRLYEESNLWKKKKEWELDNIPKKNPFIFSFKTKRQGKYTIETNVHSEPKIDSLEKRISIIAHYSDGTSKASNNAIKTTFKGNKKFEHLKISIKTNDKKELDSISGTIISYDEKEKRHFHLTDIEIRYKKENKYNTLK